ncbi:SAM-dependent methyltransferase, partial [bacterium]|nr:SAM-dependent methyltransferase [bacterium]
MKAGQLIPHKEVEIGAEQPEIAYRILQPELVSFISYPYEWSFGQLKDAALTTLAITRQALELGMLLKDASAYNIQFQHGKPVLIDTLSFEIYQEGRPWVAYRQFCQHFLAPLAL